MSVDPSIIDVYHPRTQEHGNTRDSWLVHKVRDLNKSRRVILSLLRSQLLLSCLLFFFILAYLHSVSFLHLSRQSPFLILLIFFFAMSKRVFVEVDENTDRPVPAKKRYIMPRRAQNTIEKYLQRFPIVYRRVETFITAKKVPGLKELRNLLTENDENYEQCIVPMYLRNWIERRVKLSVRPTTISAVTKFRRLQPQTNGWFDRFLGIQKIPSLDECQTMLDASDFPHVATADQVRRWFYNQRHGDGQTSGLSRKTRNDLNHVQCGADEKIAAQALLRLSLGYQQAKSRRLTKEIRAAGYALCCLSRHPEQQGSGTRRSERIKTGSKAKTD